MNNYYIYIYLDPRKSGRYCYDNICFTFEPFYVGKGKDSRIENIIGGRSDDFINIINEIKEIGIKPIIIKLYENLSEEKSFEFERKLIEEIGRIDLGTGFLINKTSGGQGNSGRLVSEEIKKLMSKKLRKNFSDIKKEFNKREYILLTEEKDYKNEYTKLNYICPRGHNGSISWGNFQQGQICSICFGNQRKNFSDIKKEFDKREYILLSKENEYKNSKTKLNYICPRGHNGFISWNNFQRREGCFICYDESRSEKMKGKNSILIIQDVIQIKLLLKEGILTQREIADIFEVDQSIISRIKTGKTWWWIKT